MSSKRTSSTRTTRTSAAGSRVTSCPPLSPTPRPKSGRTTGRTPSINCRFFNWEEDDDDDALAISCCHMHGPRSGYRVQEALSRTQENSTWTEEDLSGYQDILLSCCCFFCHPVSFLLR